MTRFHIAILPVLAILAALQTSVAKAEPLVADLSDHLVAISTGFTGTELLLFGSIDEDGDVIVVIHGPATDVTVRRKDRIAGVWVNNDAVTFQHAPSFYHVAMTDGAADGLPEPVLSRHQIGANYIRLESSEVEDPERFDTFRASLIRNQQTNGLYSTTPAEIEMRGQRLFRTSVFFPANVPIGQYVIETLLARRGEIVSAQTTPLFISKIGAGAEVFRAAHTYPALHGIVAIIIAILAGLGGNWLFRKLG